MMKERVKEICDDMIFFWGYIKKNKYKTLLVFIAFVFIVSLFGQFMLSIRMNLLEKSSYTDWISAFCNVVMAGATVVAVLAAKNYLAQFTAQEGNKIALSLLNDKLPKTTLLPDLQKEIGILKANLANYFFIDEFFKNSSISKLEAQETIILVKLSKSAEIVDDILNKNILILNREIKFDIYRIRNTGGYYVRTEDVNFIEQHIDNFSQLTLKLESAMAAIRSYLISYSEYRVDYLYDTNKIMIPENSKNYRGSINEIYIEFEGVENLINKSIAGLNKIMKAEKKVSYYFNFDN
ncbi:hypothetical protein [Yersinia enterocolitica]|uniref:hypothetical protein n=1 Tax=Yersinia enterocolitica TaxID=630 RepID=UPI001C60BA4B|nr:hypothetical protein [Yersinia enterocolitica]MBW5823339.1 hypothetical protein [Yersinia enterocolitica]